MNDNNIGSYYQKSSFIIKLIRYAVILALIIFLISCTLIYRNDITVENIQFLAKYITLNNGSSHFYNEEFQINSTKKSDIFMLRDNVAIVDKSGVALYDLSGSKLFNYTYSYSSPSAVSDSHNILIHDIKGNELSIFNSFSRVFSQKYPYSIRSASINDNGFAVISGEKGYRSSLSVYNSNFKEYFKWLSEENYLSSVSLSPNGKHVAVTTVKAVDGAYNCAVRVFDTSKEKAVYISDSFDELPVYISYSQNGKDIYVITDSNIKFYTSKLDFKASYKFNQSKIENYYTHADMILLTELNNLSGNSTKLLAFDTSGNKLFDFNINDSVTDISIGKQHIYALGNDGVYSYGFDSDYKYEFQGTAPINERYNSILCDSEENCYIVSDTTVVRVNFSNNGEE